MAETSISPHEAKRRKTSNFWGLRAKVSLAFLLPGLFVLLGVVLFAGMRLRDGLERELGQRLISVAQAAVPLLPTEILSFFQAGDSSSRSYRSLRRKLLRLQRATGARRIYVFNRKKRSLLDTRIVPIGKEYFQLSFDALELEQVFGGKPKASILFRDRFGVDYKTGFAPVFETKGGKKTVIAVVAVEGSASFFSILKDVMRSLFVIAFLTLLLVIAAMFLFSRWVVAPVSKLVTSAQDIGAGELTKPVPSLSRDEIGFLAETMEEMRKNILARDHQMQMMLSGIAHEVRNPLGGMELFSGILIEELAGDEEKLSHARRIQRELRYLANVVSSFLDFARPTVLDIQPHDLEDFYFELRMLLASDLDKKDISLKVEGDLPKTLHFDRSRLQQALLNLIQNAIQASGQDTTISIKTSPQGEGHLIELVDQGPGIPADKLERIYEPFFTTKEKGTGLGVPLAKKFIESHGGTFSIRSEEGEGTTVLIWLPETPKIQRELDLNIMM